MENALGKRTLVGLKSVRMHHLAFLFSKLSLHFQKFASKNVRMPNVSSLWSKQSLNFQMAPECIMLRPFSFFPDFTYENNDYLTICSYKLSFKIAPESTIKHPSFLKKMQVLTYEKQRLCYPLQFKNIA